jgi:uncharacterized membrane protein (DUF485 family)
MEAGGRSFRALRTGSAASLRTGPSFERLAKRRSRVVVPLFALSFAFFLVTLLIVSYCPALVSRPIVGSVNVAYLLAMLQFLTTFLIAIVYTWVARRALDPLAIRALSENPTVSPT